MITDTCRVTFKSVSRPFDQSDCWKLIDVIWLQWTFGVAHFCGASESKTPHRDHFVRRLSVRLSRFALAGVTCIPRNSSGTTCMECNRRMEKWFRRFPQCSRYLRGHITLQTLSDYQVVYLAKGLRASNRKQISRLLVYRAVKITKCCWDYEEIVIKRTRSDTSEYKVQTESGLVNWANLLNSFSQILVCAGKSDPQCMCDYFECVLNFHAFAMEQGWPLLILEIRSQTSRSQWANAGITLWTW